MANYLMLGRFTDKGIGSIQESPDRVKKLKEIIQTEGGKLSAYYMLMGHYDIACLIEAPNQEAMAKIALIIGKRGNLRTETMCAFSEKEHDDIIGKIGKAA